MVVALSFWYAGPDAFRESRRHSSDLSNGCEDCVRVVDARCWTVFATYAVVVSCRGAPLFESVES